MRKFALAVALLLAAPAHADMFQDGSNAAAQVKFPGSLGVNGGDLLSPYLPALAVRGSPAQHSIAEFTYGSPTAPLPVDPAYGYPGFRIEVYGDYGVGTADAFALGMSTEGHLLAGSRGNAVGLVARGLNEGTWTSAGSISAGAVGGWLEGRSTRGGSLFALEAACHMSVTAGGIMTCIEIDTFANTDVLHKWGIAINSQGTGATTGVGAVAGSGFGYPMGAAIMVQSVESGSSFPAILLTVMNPGGFPPVPATGSLWRAGGFTTDHGLSWPDMTFTGYAINVGPNKIKTGTIEATGLPTSCTGQPTGTLWKNAGVVNVCP